MTYHIFPSSQEHKHWIFAFYGFGQQAGVFNNLTAICCDRYGFVVIDLPYETLNSPHTKNAFIEDIHLMMKKYGIEKITGISYSMGSRYNLVLAELIPSCTDKIILVAPDGVQINFWNRVATSTSAGHFLFKYFMTHPSVYLKLLHFLYKVRLLPLPLYAFSKWHVRSHESCHKVYNTWMNMKRMIPDLKEINRHVQQYSIPLIAFFGKDDFVISHKHMRRLKENIPSADIKLVEKGHNLLDDNLFHDIAAYL